MLTEPFLPPPRKGFASFDHLELPNLTSAGNTRQTKRTPLNYYLTSFFFYPLFFHTKPHLVFPTPPIPLTSFVLSLLSLSSQPSSPSWRSLEFFFPFLFFSLPRIPPTCLKSNHDLPPPGVGYPPGVAVVVIAREVVEVAAADQPRLTTQTAHSHPRMKENSAR